MEVVKKKRTRRVRTEEEKKKDYLDNEKFHNELKEYLIKREKNPNTRMPESIGKNIIDIARGFASKYRFASYPYIEDMIQDAVYNCIKYIYNYDYEKYSNPHAYFTMYCRNAFFMKINIERKELYKKFKIQLNNDSIYGLDYQSSDEGQTITKGTAGDFYEIEKYVSDYEKSNKI